MKKFRSRVRSLSSAAWVKGTGWSSSFGLYTPHSALSILSLDSESELNFMVAFGSGTGRSGPRETGFITKGRNIRIFNMVVVLAIDAFKFCHIKVAVGNVIFSFPPHH